MKARLVLPIALASGAIGFFIGYSYGKTKAEKNIQTVLNDYREQLLNRKGKLEDALKVHDCNNSSSNISKDGSSDMGVPIYTVVNDNVEADKIISENSYSIVDEDEYSEEELPPGPSDSKKDPYPITYDEFSEENYHFSKETILYFEENDVLVYDESEEPIYDDVMLFGTEWRENIDIDKNDIGYIRNENLNTDYEIIIKRSAYVDDDLVEFDPIVHDD